MENDEIKQRAISDLYSREKLSCRETCIALKLTAPEGSKEWDAFNTAETFYELAEVVRNGCRGHNARNKARYWFKKGLALRELRILPWAPRKPGKIKNLSTCEVIS